MGVTKVYTLMEFSYLNRMNNGNYLTESNLKGIVITKANENESQCHEIHLMKYTL